MTSFPMRRQPPWVGPVDLTGGSASNPSLSDAAEPDSGWYRAAEEDWRLSLGGVDQVQLTGANATTNLIAANVFARNIYTVTLPGTHSTSQWKAFYVNVGSPGSGGDGVANADVAVSVVAAKQSAQTTTTNGEIDGITINVVQGGTDNAGLSDCSCLLLNTQHIGTVGSGSLIEGMVQHFARAGPAIDLQFSSQIGVNLPSTTLPQSYGFNVVPSIGTLNYGYYVNGAVGTVANPFYYNGGTTSNVFFIDQNSNLRAAGSIGYPTGAGTAVIQSGTTASPVTANAICGTIKTVNASWTGGFANGVTFIVNNNQVATTDSVILSQIATTGVTVPFITQTLSVGTGVFSIGLVPVTSGTSVAAINFAVIKGAVS